MKALMPSCSIKHRSRFIHLLATLVLGLASAGMVWANSPGPQERAAGAGAFHPASPAQSPPRWTAAPHFSRAVPMGRSGPDFRQVPQFTRVIPRAPASPHFGQPANIPARPSFSSLPQRSFPRSGPNPGLATRGPLPSYASAPARLGRNPPPSRFDGADHGHVANDVHPDAFDHERGDRGERGGEYEHHDYDRLGDHDRHHWEDDDHEHHHWDGGYWRGRYWPRAYDADDFVWFLPVLPPHYVTYWWAGVPYYYYNDAYYTWDADYGGYVAMDPPPIIESSPAEYSAPLSAGFVDADGTSLFAYPMRGQSPEQQAQDRYDCQQWAANQSSATGYGDADQYRRALSACLRGRGYSVG